MRAFRAVLVVALLLVGAAAALLLLRAREEPPAPPEPVAVPGVVVVQREDGIVAANEHGRWTVLTACRSDGDRTVGPGYVSRVLRPDGSVLLDDEGPPQPLNDPGHGGLGAFAWHHARGRPGALRLAEDNAWEVSGRICAGANGGFGVSASRLLEAPAAGGEAGDEFVSFAVEVELSDRWTQPEPLMRVRYRYRVHRDAVRSWIAVTELCGGGRCGDTRELAFVKEPKLAAGLRAGEPLPYSRAAVFDGNGELRCVYVSGGPPEGPVLDTGQCAHPGRERLHFDAGSEASGPDGGCGEEVACLEVTARAHPVRNGDVAPDAAGSPWAGRGMGFDAWAEEAAARPAAFDRDTASVDGVVWDCHGGSPDGELVRRWETIARIDEEGRHLALSVLLTAWQGGRGDYDCEPLLRAFGPEGETWGAFLGYRLLGP